MPRQTHSYCPRCGEIRAGTTGEAVVCGHCRLHPPPWSAVIFWGGYVGLLRQLLVRLKFAGELGLAGLLGWMLAEAVRVRGLVADVVVPVPMRPQGLVERGFNQSVELGRMLSRHLGWPLFLALSKTRDTQRQARLSCAERQKNVAGAFACASVEGMRVVLVDDIMTTGATARECAVALRAAGARDVWCAVVARA